VFSGAARCAPRARIAPPVHRRASRATTPVTWHAAPAAVRAKRRATRRQAFASAAGRTSIAPAPRHLFVIPLRPSASHASTTRIAARPHPSASFARDTVCSAFPARNAPRRHRSAETISNVAPDARRTQAARPTSRSVTLRPPTASHACRPPTVRARPSSATRGIVQSASTTAPARSSAASARIAGASNAKTTTPALSSDRNALKMCAS